MTSALLSLCLLPLALGAPAEGDTPPASEAPPPASPAPPPAAPAPAAPAPAAPAPPAAATSTAAEPDAATPTVLVSVFQPGSKDAVGVSSLLEVSVARALDPVKGLEVLRVDEAPPFPDYDARVYMESCPPGNIVECTQLLGERAGARFAVTGSAVAIAAGVRVRVSVLDVAQAREVVAFRYDVAEGEDAVLADAVARVVLAVAEGRLGAPDDIRDGAEEEDEPRLTNEQVAAQLAELAPQLAAAQEVVSRPPRSIDTRRYTTADVDSQRGEGMKDWERLDMSPGEWLRYKNSGLSLYEWRKRSLGHAGQLLLRAEGGWWRGPTGGAYVNRHAYDDSLVIIDSYSALAARSQGEPTGGFEVGYGVLPFLDVAAGLGVAPGEIEVDVDVEGDISTTGPLRVYPWSSWYGLRVEGTLFPAASFHPALGGGVTLVRTVATTSVLDLPDYAADFPSENLLYATLWPGVQARLGPRLDLYARLPVDLLLSGTLLREERTTTTAAVVPNPPSTSGDVGVGVLLGVQVRLFGREPKAGALDDTE